MSGPFRPLFQFSPHRLALVVGMVMVVLAWDARATEDPPARANPRLTPPPSTLHRPFGAPVILAVYGALGGGLEAGQESAEPGIGGAIVFRPGSAANFLDFLYDWHTGLVLQVDYQQLSDTDDVLAADGILRRYFGNRGRNNTEVRLFLGAGIGAARFSVPETGGQEYDRYWCGLVEAGQEWLTGEKWYFFLKGQFRYHLHRQRNYRAWSVQLGAGLPWPW